MGIRTYKPKTQGLRFKSTLTFDELTRRSPEKSLTTKLSSKAGRSRGRISVWHKGGGHKRVYRKIDFKRDKEGVPGKVAEIEYDPNRSANIALIFYQDGEKRYILAPHGLKKGDFVVSGSEASIQLGNALPLNKIPIGTRVHNIELQLGKGGQLVRSAGVSALVVAKEGEYVLVKLPSSETRLIFNRCFASIGELGNSDHMNVKLGKAGHSRHLGVRPTVRGVVMNPHDHPLGGGEGKSSGGRHPVTPWGVPTKGYKTRNPKKRSTRFIVTKRKVKK